MQTVIANLGTTLQLTAQQMLDVQSQTANQSIGTSVPPLSPGSTSQSSADGASSTSTGIPGQVPINAISMPPFHQYLPQNYPPQNFQNQNFANQNFQNHNLSSQNQNQGNSRHSNGGRGDNNNNSSGNRNRNNNNNTNSNNNNNNGNRNNYRGNNNQNRGNYNNNNNRGNNNSNNERRGYQGNNYDQNYHGCGLGNYDNNYRPPRRNYENNWHQNPFDFPSYMYPTSAFQINNTQQPFWPNSNNFQNFSQQNFP